MATIPKTTVPKTIVPSPPPGTSPGGTLGPTKFFSPPTQQSPSNFGTTQNTVATKAGIGSAKAAPNPGDTLTLAPFSPSPGGYGTYGAPGAQYRAQVPTGTPLPTVQSNTGTSQSGATTSTQTSGSSAPVGAKNGTLPNGTYDPNYVPSLEELGDPGLDEYTRNKWTANYYNAQGGEQIDTSKIAGSAKEMLDIELKKEAAQKTQLESQVEYAKRVAKEKVDSEVAATNATVGGANREGPQSVSNPMVAQGFAQRSYDQLDRQIADLDFSQKQLEDAQAAGNTELVGKLGEQVAAKQAAILQAKNERTQLTNQTISTLASQNAFAGLDDASIKYLQDGMPGAPQGVIKLLADAQTAKAGTDAEKSKIEKLNSTIDFAGKMIDKGITLDAKDILDFAKTTGISTDFWLNVQSQVQQVQADKNLDNIKKMAETKKILEEAKYIGPKLMAESSPYEFRTETDEYGVQTTAVYNKITGQRVSNMNGIFTSTPSNAAPFNYQGGEYVGYDPNDITKALGIDPVTFRAQCGRLVNQATGIGVADSFASKMAKCDPNITQPKPGMVFVMPTSAPWGHTGIVAGLSRDGNSILAYDANWNDKSAPETVQVHSIPISKITGYAMPQSGSKLANFVNSNFPNADVAKQAKLPVKLAQDVNTIARDFQKEPIAKNYAEVARNIDYINTIDPNKATFSDKMALIYTFARIMDPTSSVREGEYASVGANARSFVDSLGLSAEKVFNNPGELPAKSVMQLQNTLNNKYQGFEDQYDEYKKGWANQIDLLGTSRFGVGGNELLDSLVTIKRPNNKKAKDSAIINNDTQLYHSSSSSNSGDSDLWNSL